MDRGVVATSILSLLGMVVMAVVAQAAGPRHVPLPELLDHVGVPIVTEADVLSVRGGGPFARLVLADANRSIDAVSDGPTPVSPGDRVRVEGTPERFQGRIQLRIEPDGLVVIRPWREHHVPLAALLGDPWPSRGTNLVTSGVLVRAPGLVLRDTAGVGAVAASNPSEAPTGVPIVVEARLEYEPSDARFRLEVLAWEPSPPSGR